MEEQKIDYNDVIESLNGQLTEKSSALAFHVAIIKQKDARVKELEMENKQLHEEQVKELDKQANETKNKKGGNKNENK